MENKTEEKIREDLAFLEVKIIVDLFILFVRRNTRLSKYIYIFISKAAESRQPT